MGSNDYRIWAPHCPPSKGAFTRYDLYIDMHTIETRLMYIINILL